jgi:hypothetical protein
MKPWAAACLMVILPVVLSDHAAAVTIEMTCKNPRREYRLVFNDFARSLVAKTEEDDTAYRVDNVKRIGDDYIVTGVATYGGPRYTAIFGTDQKSIQFFIGNGAPQTDYCR